MIAVRGGDVLIEHTDGVTVISDEIGNIVDDVYRSFTWQHGRQLASMEKTGAETSWRFTYHADGLRTKRTDDVVTYSYTYNGSQLTGMTVDGHTLYFAYDALGTPLSVNYDGTEYYYITNLQGDVVGIIDSTGSTVAAYSYSAWGEPQQAEDIPVGTLAYYNPLRYRGYVYDEETGLYYLQSRYYDPYLCRFINADTFPSTGQDFVGNNMFAYCGNNPISRADNSGESWILTILGILAAGTLVGGACGAFSAATTGGNVIEGFIEGCLTGLLSSACAVFAPTASIAVGLSFIGSAFIDFSTQAVMQYMENESIDLSKVDYLRVLKVASQTGICAYIPAFGAGAANAIDAFATALIWAECSVLITALDVVVTNMFGLNDASNTNKSNNWYGAASLTLQMEAR